jgi:hypothetical protein
MRLNTYSIAYINLPPASTAVARRPATYLYCRVMMNSNVDDSVNKEREKRAKENPSKGKSSAWHFL